MLETIWDIERDGGDSTVQRNGETCLKIYPEQHEGKSVMSRKKLETYHKFQGDLGDVSIAIDDESLRQDMIGYDTIRISFLDLRGFRISEGSYLDTGVSALFVELPYIDGVSLHDTVYCDELMSIIEIDFLRRGFFWRELFVGLNPFNLKLVKGDSRTLEIICTDCFCSISESVDFLITD